MTLKTPQINLSFGLNGSHKARKVFSAKVPGFCPPPDISKANERKEFRPIMSAHGLQNGHKLRVANDLQNLTFSKKHNVLDRIYKV